MARRLKSRRRDKSRRNKLMRKKGKSKRRYNKSKRRRTRTAGMFDVLGANFDMPPEQTRKEFRSSMRMGQGKKDFKLLTDSQKQLTEKMMNSQEKFEPLGSKRQKSPQKPRKRTNKFISGPVVPTLALLATL